MKPELNAQNQQHMHQRTIELEQETIEAASASDGTGAAPVAGEAAAHGAGEAASAGSQSRSRSRSRSIASSVQVDGKRPRWWYRRPTTPPRQLAPSSRTGTQSPERAAEAILPPRMAPSKVSAPTPKVMPRKPAPSTIPPMRRRPLPSPSMTPSASMKGGRVGSRQTWLAHWARQAY